MSLNYTKCQILRFKFYIFCGRELSCSDISVTETKTDTEMIDFSKTHTETNAEKIFNTDTETELK